MYICQNCGMQILTENHFGTNYDSSINRDFCSDCYKGGSFTSNVNELNDFNFFPGAFALGQAGADYDNGIGIPYGVPYFFDLDE